MSKAPNIVLVMADQLAPQFLSCYGHPIVRTPFLDQLAAQAVVFDAAYCNAPLCAPSRYSMMTGRLPSQIAAWDNASEWSSEVPTFAHYLSMLGYKTCLSGKMHFVGPDQLHGFESRLTTDVYPADFTWHPDWREPNKLLDWYHNMEVVTKAGTCIRSAYLDYDDEVIFRAQRYLYDHARESEQRPFLLTVSFIQPHDPYIAREEHWNLYQNDEIDLPSTAFDASQADPHSLRLRRIYGADRTTPTEAQIRNARRAYYASTSYIDEKIKQLHQVLVETEQADNTVIIFTADHGDMLGERGLWFKMSFFEHSVRVPLIIHAPKLFAARRIPAAVSLVDLLPTLVDLAHGSRFQDYATVLEGRSLLPHLQGQAGHDEAIGEYFGEGLDTPMFMIRREAYKFIAAQGDPLQLYELTNDPLEHKNLAVSGHAKLAEFQADSAQRWDIESLRQRVIESQDRRRLLKQIMLQQKTSWDFHASEDAATQYIRSYMPLYAIETKSRYPQV